MLKDIKEQYIEYYTRLHYEIRESFVSLYYLKALNEVQLFDKAITFRNEFASYLCQCIKEKICLQIYKLILDGTNNNRKTIENFVKFINNNKIFNTEIKFERLTFIDNNLENLITRYRNNYINHINIDNSLIPIKINEMEKVLLEIPNYFNKLYKKEFVPINDRFYESYLSRLEQKCKIAVMETIKMAN